MLLALLAGVALAGCATSADTQTNGAGEILSADSTATIDPSTDSPDEGLESTGLFTVYFSDENGSKLVAESRPVEPSTDTPTAAVEALLGSPTPPNQPTMPAETRLLGIVVDANIATVDLSSELIENHPGGSSAERLTVYSLVNTLCELEEVDRVIILVEGAKVDTISGHLDTSGPLVPDESLL